MGYRETPVKEVMSMKKFWSALSNLLDQGWKPEININWVIRLLPQQRKSSYGIKVSYDLVSAVAYGKGHPLGPYAYDWELAAKKLRLSSHSARRVISAAQDTRGVERTRFKIIHFLKLEKPFLAYVPK